MITFRSELVGISRIVELSALTIAEMAHDGNVLVMTTVVCAPAIVTTVANESLCSSTVYIIKPDLSRSRATFVLQSLSIESDNNRDVIIIISTFVQFYSFTSYSFWPMMTVVYD